MFAQASTPILLAGLLIAPMASAQHHPGEGHHHGQGEAQRFKPFDDVDAYIRHLERGDRAAWQKPEKVVAWLGLKGDETLVDVGAGSGYFTFRFTNALPGGRVVATDIEQAMLDHIRAQADKAGVRNLSTALATATDPRIPAKADIVFVCNVYHHIPDRPAWLASVKRQMRPGARLIFLEFTAESPVGPPARIRLSPAALTAELEAAGFRRTELNTELLPHQYAAVFVR